MADSRARRVTRVGSAAELLAEAATAGGYPLEQRQWVDAPAVGRKLLAGACKA